MPELISKLPSTGTSIFAIMSKMAADHNAINLSQGFPDFNCSPELISLVNKYSRDGYNQYCPMTGILPLREKISAKINELYGRYYDPEKELNITSGATQALYTAITALIDVGDEVILFEPAYDSYAPVIELNKGIPVYIALEGDDYHINWEQVKEKINSKTRLIIINSPHNPTGSLIGREDISHLEEITRDRNIFIISDEVYEHITFDGHSHISLALSEELSAKSFIIFSFGKTYHTTGWKVGYVCAPVSMMAEFRKVHQFTVFSVNTPVQYAYAEYIDRKEEYLHLSQFYQDKRDLFNAAIEGAGYEFLPSKGTYFQLLNYSRLSKLNDIEYSEYLTKKAGVAVIPLSPFTKLNKTRKVIRVCFAKKDEVLEVAADRLKVISSNLLK